MYANLLTAILLHLPLPDRTIFSLLHFLTQSIPELNLKPTHSYPTLQRRCVHSLFECGMNEKHLLFGFGSTALQLHQGGNCSFDSSFFANVRRIIRSVAALLLGFGGFVNDWTPISGSMVGNDSAAALYDAALLTPEKYGV